MVGENKRTGSPAAVPPPSTKERNKRRKVAAKVEQKDVHQRPFVLINLDSKTRTAMGLVNPEFIYVKLRKYLENIDDRNRYLYDVVRRVAECDFDAVKLYRQDNGALRPDDAVGWTPVDPVHIILGGHYLCTIRPDSCKPVQLDPVLISRRGGTISRQNSASSSRQPSPAPALVPGSKTVNKLESSPLRQALENQNLEKVMETRISKPRNQCDKFRANVETNDTCCVVTGTSPSHSIASHIIPVSVISYKLQSNPVVSIGSRQISNPFDEELGILLEPGIDHHFNRYEASIYTHSDNSASLHLLKCSASSSKDADWVPSARLYDGKPVRIVNYVARTGILDHHYRHAVVLAWGSAELKERLLPDLNSDAEEDWIAELLETGY